MNPLNLSKLEMVDHIVTPKDFQETTLASSAMCIFTDFKRVQPLVIDSNTKATDAQLLMEKAHVRLKLVISEKKRIIGLLSSLDISERQIIRRIASGDKREDLLVTDLMQPRELLFALDYSELCNATVKQLLDTLQSNGLSHCLVVDHVNHQIRGLISTSDIAKQLRIPLYIDKPLTFANIFSVIHG